MDKEQLERKLHIVHLLASCYPKDVKLIRRSHVPVDDVHPAQQRLRLVSTGVCFIPTH